MSSLNNNSTTVSKRSKRHLLLMQFRSTVPSCWGVDDIVRAGIEKKHNANSGRNRLAFCLTTTGGYIEVVQRIVDTVRKHYQLIDFVIPNYAYFAGTVLALSGDAIYMDYYSRLGPIDPQVETRSGQMVSAIGYLERYEKLIAKAARNTISAAEVQILIQGFDQGDLYYYEQARELSIALLKDWLVRYKSSNCVGRIQTPCPPVRTAVT
jgi:hypothetical protein